MSNCFKKRRCCAIERFCLKIGLRDCPLNSDTNSIGVLMVILRGASTPPFSTLFALYFRAFPNWAAMLKTEPARQKRRKWAQVPLREWQMKCPPGLVELTTPILLLSLCTGLSGEPIFSQKASIAPQRRFWLGTAFCMRNLSFFVRAGLKAFWVWFQNSNLKK